jgi:hypothetical protein
MALANIKKQCVELGLDPGFTVVMLRRALKVYKKDIRSTPFVKKLLEAFTGLRESEIQHAVEVYEKKSYTTNEPIHPNYLIKVLKSTVQDATKSPNTQRLNWGKTI